jgi:hypothetical protein
MEVLADRGGIRLSPEAEEAQDGEDDDDEPDNVDDTVHG